jgi:hypothetical protein
LVVSREVTAARLRRLHDYLRVDHRIVHGLLQRLDDLIQLARTLDDYVRRAAGDA